MLISVEQVKKLHEILIDETGGEYGIRDEGLLSSAVSSAFASFDGSYLYPTIEEKAARIGFGIIKNHPFIDGNKRVGLLAMITFLEINRVYLSYTDDELIEIGLFLADGKTVNYEDGHRHMLNWILSHKKP